ncbi:MAG: hypothetical protein HY563_05105 [Ignavibacteriales bacterium]|nr:hypothetical protein [Ignavibacteriales bacterium]
MISCRQCGRPVSELSSECPACGAVPAGSAPLECELHAGSQAVARCVVCGKPVCGDCATKTEGRFFCDVMAHRALAAETTVITGCASPFEADMIRENLAQAGLDIVVFSRNDFIVLFRSADPGVSDVRVRADQAEYAREILRNLALDEESRREPDRPL